MLDSGLGTFIFISTPGDSNAGWLEGTYLKSVKIHHTEEPRGEPLTLELPLEPVQRGWGGFWEQTGKRWVSFATGLRSTGPSWLTVKEKIALQRKTT